MADEVVGRIEFGPKWETVKLSDRTMELIQKMKDNYVPRPVERIERVLGLLRQAWYADPDQRLGQLLINFGRNPDGSIVDIWNIEDDEWERRLKASVENPGDDT